MSKSDEWCTPPETLEFVRAVGPISYDPCSNEHSQVGAARAGMLRLAPYEDGVVMEFDPHRARGVMEYGVDGLATDWFVLGHGGVTFFNPPYSKPNLHLWTRKATEEAARGWEGVGLVPAFTADGWFVRNVWASAQAIAFCRGRIKFWENGRPGKSCARFSSCLPYWGPRAEHFCGVAERHGYNAVLVNPYDMDIEYRGFLGGKK